MTEFTYNGDGQILTRTAKAPAAGEGDQTTAYFYNTIDNTNGVQSAERATTRLLAKVRYPDHDDPQGTSGEVKMKFNLAGQLVERVDQRGTKVTPVYDAAGRMTMQYVDGTNTTGGPLLGARALGFTFNTRGQLLTATTWSSNTDTSDANLLTKVVREYDGWGNLTKEKQWQTYDSQDQDKFKYKKEVAFSHSYSSGSNYLRPNTITYPTGSRVLTYGYGDGSAGAYTSAYVSSQVNRMDRLTWDGTLVSVFTFTGSDRTDTRTYRKGTGENDLVAQTNYRFDAFGRMNEIDATDTVGAHVVDFRRAYDYNGNPLYTEYAHKTTRSEIYGTQTGQNPEGPADHLNRLTRYRRGTLNANKDDLTATVFEQDWHDTQAVLKLDKLGNWDMVRTDTTGGGTFTVETKGHNLANEYTSKNGQSFFAHDDDGNLTDDGTYTFSYDFANHLVKAVRKSDSATIGEYLYDALGRRVKKVVTNTDTYDGTTLFYYDGLRVREEGKLDGNNAYKATHQYVWGLYLDELLVYDHDGNGDGDFADFGDTPGDRRSYCLQDLLYSTAAVLDPSGAVLERYDYEPYGKPTIWNGDYTATRAETAVFNDVLFTGQRYDPESGLYHYKDRNLHPILGRLLQHDRIGYYDSMNLFLYANSSPSSYTDPLGLASQAQAAILLNLARRAITTEEALVLLTMLTDSVVAAQLVEDVIRERARRRPAPHAPPHTVRPPRDPEPRPIEPRTPAPTPGPAPSPVSRPPIPQGPLGDPIVPRIDPAPEPKPKCDEPKPSDPGSGKPKPPQPTSSPSEPPKRCLPCIPPVGTKGYQYHTQHLHRDWTTHTHHLRMNQSPPTAETPCFCHWMRSTTPGFSPFPGEILLPDHVKAGGGGLAP